MKGPLSPWGIHHINSCQQRVQGTAEQKCPVDLVVSREGWYLFSGTWTCSWSQVRSTFSSLSVWQGPGSNYCKGASPPQLTNSVPHLIHSKVCEAFYFHFTNYKTDPYSIGSVIATRLIPLAISPIDNVLYLSFCILTRILSIFIALISSLNISIVYHVLIFGFLFYYDKHNSCPLGKSRD